MEENGENNVNDEGLKVENPEGAETTTLENTDTQSAEQNVNDESQESEETTTPTEEKKQAYIAQVDAQTQQMMQRANQFMGSDPDAQASMINEAQQQVQQQSQLGQTAQQILPTVNKQQDIDTINKRLAILKNAVSKYKAKQATKVT